MPHTMGSPTSRRRGYGSRTLSATFRSTQVVREISGRATLPEFGLDAVAAFECCVRPGDGVAVVMRAKTRGEAEMREQVRLPQPYPFSLAGALATGSTGTLAAIGRIDRTLCGHAGFRLRTLSGSCVWLRPTAEAVGKTLARITAYDHHAFHEDAEPGDGGLHWSPVSVSVTRMSSGLP